VNQTSASDLCQFVSEIDQVSVVKLPIRNVASDCLRD